MSKTGTDSKEILQLKSKKYSPQTLIDNKLPKAHSYLSEYTVILHWYHLYLFV